MSSNWHGEKNEHLSFKEVEMMVLVLEGRHGVWAAEIADFFALAHDGAGNPEQCLAWQSVANDVRLREIARTTEP